MANNHDVFYAQNREHFLKFDQQEMIDYFRLRHDDGNIYFRILGKEAALDRKTAVVTVDGKMVGFGAAATAYDILSRAKNKPVLSGRWVSITELGGSIATGHVSKLSGEHSGLQGRCAEIREICRSWGGVEQKQGDVSFIVPLYDFFPVWVQFWDADDEFPAQFRCLWDASTLDFMFYETTWYANGFLLGELKRGT